MSRWHERPIEVQRLFNPSFCTVLLWHACLGHVENSTPSAGISFEESFLVLPIVLHQETRESLPRRADTSLAVWIGMHPLATATIADRARSLIPFTKEALRFAGAYGVLQFNQTLIQANPEWRRRMASALRDSSDEVRACANRAEFVGKWFAKTGNTETVLALIGIQP